MAKATNCLPNKRKAFNRRALLTSGASIVAAVALGATPASAGAAPAASVLAPTALGREMLELMLDIRQIHHADPESGNVLSVTRRYRKSWQRRLDAAYAREAALTSAIYAQPLSLSAIVDRAILAHWRSDNQDQDLTRYLSANSAQELFDNPDLGEPPQVTGFIAGVLALAGLPLAWDDKVARFERSQHEQTP